MPVPSLPLSLLSPPPLLVADSTQQSGQPWRGSRGAIFTTWRLSSGNHFPTLKVRETTVLPVEPPNKDHGIVRRYTEYNNRVQIRKMLQTVCERCRVSTAPFMLPLANFRNENCLRLFVVVYKDVVVVETM